MTLPVCIHRKKPTARNMGVVIIAFGGSDAGNWNRCFKYKNIEGTPCLSRAMIAEEEEVYKASWRMRWVEYASWEDLIRDEWKITKNIEWCDKLQKASGGKMPLNEIIDTEQIEKKPFTIQQSLSN